MDGDVNFAVAERAFAHGVWDMLFFGCTEFRQQATDVVGYPALYRHAIQCETCRPIMAAERLCR